MSNNYCKYDLIPVCLASQMSIRSYSSISKQVFSNEIKTSQ